MAFQDVLDKIADDLLDNNDRLITPAVLRGVLNDLAQWAQDDKVDKVAGKGLSDENYTLSEKGKLSNIEAGAEVNTVSPTDLVNKVDKIAGKGLSDENYTLSEKNKLSNIEAGAEVNTVSPTDLVNKVDKIAGKGLSDENYTLSEKNKLSGIEAGAEVNRNFGLGANEVRSGDHVHYKYLGGGIDDIELTFTSDDKLITHLSYGNSGDVMLLSIAAGEEGQSLTIFTALKIDLSSCPDIETTISELTVGSNDEFSNITFMYLAGLWRQVGLVQYS